MWVGCYPRMELGCGSRVWGLGWEGLGWGDLGWEGKRRDGMGWEECVGVFCVCACLAANSLCVSG